MSPEDFYIGYFPVIFERLIRAMGLFIALFLPGLYIAIATYHQEQIPLTLLATLNMNRKGVPFPTPLEAFIMLILFELFREAGIRLPNVIGQTLAVVGGLIIGESAIRAGLTNPSMLVVIGTTVVASFTLINQTLVSTVSILRMGVLLLSSLLGVFGFLLSLFSIVTYLANLRSFGLPYLAPAAPFHFHDLLQSTVRLFIRKRPQMLDPVDSTREGENK